MDVQLLAGLNAARAARQPCVVVTELADGSSRLVQPDELAKAPLAGTALSEAIGEGLRSGRSAMVEIDGKQLFLAVQVPPVKLVVIGAVHISQALAPMAAQVGFEMIVVDPRTAFASPERFPDVRVLAEWPDIALPTLGIDAYTAFIVLTHDPKIDDPGISHALERNCFYIGALGSSRTHKKRAERMRAAGYTEEQIGRIHAPIGLNIGAISPAEIAVSILSQIIATLRAERVAAKAAKAAA